MTSKITNVNTTGKMKAKLTFKIPKEKREFELATNANDIYNALHEFSDYLRAKYKYSDDKADWWEIREKLLETCLENGVDMEGGKVINKKVGLITKILNRIK